MTLVATLIRTAKPIGLFTVAALSLSACNLDRLSSIGEEPKLAAIENPVKQKDYKPVTLPMPAPEVVEKEANSLWRPGSRAFFRDQRAHRVGDILTVEINIADKGELSNNSTRTRADSEDNNLTNLLGLETLGRKILPQAFSSAAALTLSNTLSNAGTGQIKRSETFETKIAAMIIQVLPNGNFIVRGTQQIRLNYEMREMIITGIVRPEDITATNTINSDDIAEARISYGGKGTISEVQQPRYGYQIMEAIMPF